MAEQGTPFWVKIVFVVIAFIIIIGVAILISGANGFFSVIKTTGIMAIVIIVIVLIVIGVWFLFFKEFQRDITHEEKVDMENAGEITKPDTVTDLWLSGDETHPPVKLGAIKGISYRKNYKLLDMKPEFQELTPEEKEQYLKIHHIKKDIYDKYFQEETAFSFKRGFKTHIIRCPPHMHSKIHGQIYIYDIGIVKHSEYFYPSRLHLDFETIDETIYAEGQRRSNFELIRLTFGFLKQASGIQRRYEEEIKPITGKEKNTGKEKK